MGFIENLRQLASEGYDKLTDQQNTYHMSTGKTQKEYQQDVDFYKRLEDATRKSATVLGAIEGAALGGGSSYYLARDILPVALGNAGLGAWVGHLYPWVFSMAQKKGDMIDNEGYFLDKDGVPRDKREYYRDEDGNLKKRK